MELRNSSIITSSHFISCTSSTGYEQLAEVSEPQSTMSDQICSACETKAEFSLNCCSMNNLIEAKHTGTFHLVYDHFTIPLPLMDRWSFKWSKLHYRFDSVWLICWYSTSWKLYSLFFLQIFVGFFNVVQVSITQIHTNFPCYFAYFEIPGGAWRLESKFITRFGNLNGIRFQKFHCAKQHLISRVTLA